MENNIISLFKDNKKIYEIIQQVGIKEAWKYVTFDSINAGIYDKEFILPCNYESIKESDDLELVCSKMNKIENNFLYLARLGHDYNHLLDFIDIMKEGEKKIEFINKYLPRYKNYLISMLIDKAIFDDKNRFTFSKAYRCWKLQYLADYNLFLLKHKKGKKYKQQDSDIL